jgi:ERCC4-related helicase
MNREKDQKKSTASRGSDIRLREIQTVHGPVEAEVIKSLLESQGIKCIFKGLVVQSVHAFSANGLGEIKIMVSEEDYEDAKQLISGQVQVE